MLRRLFQPNSRKPPHLLGERRIHLHLGAHKTATTYLQKILSDNRELLLDRGVLFLPLIETRTKVSRHLLAISKSERDPAGLRAHRKALLDGLGREALARCHTVLISDENLSGVPGSFAKGKLYQSIRHDWTHVHDELGPNISVSFSIRDYPGFLVSIYAEIIRKKQFIRFQEIRKLAGRTPALWSQVHQDLSSAFGAQNVTLWDFKDTVDHPEKVLRMLTGIDAPVEIRSSPARESLSKRAIEFIRDFQRLPGHELSPELVAEVARRLYPLKDYPEKLDPWLPERRAALLAHYQAEKARLPVMKF